MTTSESQPVVAIVLCTYNGAQHLIEQMNSLLAQSWPVAIRVFDDASSDDTVALLETYKDKLDVSITINKKNVGYVANFEAGIAQVISEGFNYIALSDQDDIWNAERIATGMQAIVEIENRHGAQSAALTHSDLRMIDSDKKCIHSSFFKYRNYEITNTRSVPTVLGQNGVMGNTILMNRALAVMAQSFPEKLHVHDYWLAVLAELHGHRVLIEQALVDYRIHDANASNSTENTKFGLVKLLDGKSWTGLVERDFRLPFKEDYRLNVIDALLSEGTQLPKLSIEDNQLVTTFRRYLVFKGSRREMFRSMIGSGFFRKGLRHRARLAFSTMLTKRYDQ